MKTIKVQCVICKGQGKINAPNKSVIEMRQDMSIILRKSGYTLDQIAIFLGYKGRQGVYRSLNRKNGKMKL